MRLIVSATALLLASSVAAQADCNHPAAISIGASGDSAVESLPATTIDCYQLTAQAGQRISVTVVGTSNDTYFALYAPGWTASCNTADDCDINGDQLSGDDITSWTDTAPVSGAYLIVIDNSHSDADYHISVSLH